MSNNLRVDLLGLEELDPTLASEPAFPYLVGMPSSRESRIAARRAFVEMKQLFLRAVENLEHRKGAWLRDQVRGAEDPTDLWLIRGPLLAALREDDVATRTMRAALYKCLDATFPTGFGAPGTSAAATLRA